MRTYSFSETPLVRVCNADAPGKAFVTLVTGVVIVTALTTYLKYLSAIQLPF